MALGLSGVQPEAVVVAPLPARPATRVLRHAARTRGFAGAVRAAAGRLISRLAAEPEDDATDRWRGLARQVIRTSPLNSEGMVSTIASLRPDWLVLAETGIVKAPVLDIPTRGTLNAHPALLPYLRGVGVVERAVRSGWPVGVTVHRVDRGIDTGPILRRRLVPVTETETLRSLRAKTDRLCVALLTEAVVAVLEDTPVAHEQTERFIYSTWPTVAESAEAADLVRQGRALAAYNAARRLAGGDEIPPTLALEPLADV